MRGEKNPIDMPVGRLDFVRDLHEGKMSDHNARQFNLMIERLNAFEKKAITLDHLVSSLDGLQNALQDVDMSWKNAFLKQWGVLEDVYADALDRNLKKIPDQHMGLLRGAIQEIRKLIAEKSSVHIARRRATAEKRFQSYI